MLIYFIFIKPLVCFSSQFSSLLAFDFPQLCKIFLSFSLLLLTSRLFSSILTNLLLYCLFSLAVLNPVSFNRRSSFRLKTLCLLVPGALLISGCLSSSSFFFWVRIELFVLSMSSDFCFMKILLKIWCPRRLVALAKILFPLSHCNLLFLLISYF